MILCDSVSCGHSLASMGARYPSSSAELRGSGCCDSVQSARRLSRWVLGWVVDDFSCSGEFFRAVVSGFALTVGLNRSSSARLQLAVDLRSCFAHIRRGFSSTAVYSRLIGTLATRPVTPSLLVFCCLHSFSCTFTSYLSFLVMLFTCSCSVSFCARSPDWLSCRSFGKS